MADARSDPGGCAGAMRYALCVTATEAAEVRLDYLERRQIEDRADRKVEVAGVMKLLGRLEDKFDALDAKLDDQVASSRWTPQLKVALTVGLATPVVGALAIILGVLPGTGVPT